MTKAILIIKSLSVIEIIINYGYHYYDIYNHQYHHYTYTNNNGDDILNLFCSHIFTVPLSASETDFYIICLVLHQKFGTKLIGHVFSFNHMHNIQLPPVTKTD